MRQIKTRTVSSITYPLNSNNNLNPNFVSGFIDAEGCFHISMTKNSNLKLGVNVRAKFSIHLHLKDLHLLCKLKEFFNVGTIIKSKKSANFTVDRIDDLVNIIIPHFNKYPLQSAKSIDFELWCKCVEVIKSKEHLTLKGIEKISKFKSALNKGLPEHLKKIFPGTMERPKFVVSTEPLSPYWVSGFSEGDGSFFVSISDKTKQIRMFYSIKLNNRETPLILKLQEFFNGMGSIVHDADQNIVQFNIVSIKNINEGLVPQFDTYSFVGNKLANYLIWKEILKLVNSKAYLTPEGLEKIKDLKSTLNKWDI